MCDTLYAQNSRPKWIAMDTKMALSHGFHKAIGAVD
jgi:hypothetical protein